MSWFKPEEKHYTVNRRTRDRKGGHSPKILFNDDGVVFVTPPQKREEKRRVTRNRRKEAKLLAHELVSEFIEDLKIEAEEADEMDWYGEPAIDDDYYRDDPDPDWFEPCDEWIDPYDDWF